MGVNDLLRQLVQIASTPAVFWFHSVNLKRMNLYILEDYRYIQQLIAIIN